MDCQSEVEECISASLYLFDMKVNALGTVGPVNSSSRRIAAAELVFREKVADRLTNSAIFH